MMAELSSYDWAKAMRQWMTKPGGTEQPNKREVRMREGNGHWASADYIAGDTAYSYGSGDLLRAPSTDPSLPAPVPVKVLDPLGYGERARLDRNEHDEWEARRAR